MMLEIQGSNQLHRIDGRFRRVVKDLDEDSDENIPLRIPHPHVSMHSRSCSFKRTFALLVRDFNIRRWEVL